MRDIIEKTNLGDPYEQEQVYHLPSGGVISSKPAFWHRAALY